MKHQIKPTIIEKVGTRTSEDVSSISAEREKKLYLLDATENFSTTRKQSLFRYRPRKMTTISQTSDACRQSSRIIKSQSYTERTSFAENRNDFVSDPNDMGGHIFMTRHFSDPCIQQLSIFDCGSPCSSPTISPLSSRSSSSTSQSSLPFKSSSTSSTFQTCTSNIPSSSVLKYTSASSTMNTSQNSQVTSNSHPVPSKSSNGVCSKSRLIKSPPPARTSSSFSFSSSLLWLCFIVLMSRLLRLDVEAAALIPQQEMDDFLEGIILEDVDEKTDDKIAEIDEYLTNFGYYSHATTDPEPADHPKRHRKPNGRKHHRKPRDVGKIGPIIDVYASTDFGNSQQNFEHKPPIVRSRVHSKKEREHALKRFQDFFGLPVTGQLDEATLDVMTKPRCGMVDVTADDDVEDDKLGVAQDEDGNEGSHHRQKRYTISKYSDGTVAKWEIPELTWKIIRPSRQIDESTQRRVFHESLAAWQKVMPITFREHSEGSGEEADIRIQFFRREHGPAEDPVFDGKKKTQNVLAHAWGPNIDTKGFAGDVHFDEDDDWSDPQGLKNVAVHELGHSMGLLHSKDRTAIMYPVYRNVSTLAQDDINGINAIYGGPRGGIRPVIPDPRDRFTQRPRRTERPTIRPYFTVKPQWVTPPPITDIDKCADVRVDYVFVDPTEAIGDVFVVISGDHAHRLTSRGTLIQSQLLHAAYPEAPAEADVIFSIPRKETVYFIKDNAMWAYRGNQLADGYPISLKPLGFPEKPRFAVNVDDGTGNSRYLLFSKNYWWTFDVDRMSMSSKIRYDPISSFSRDLPADVKFAARWTDGYLYVVTTDSYVILDPLRRQLIRDKPIAGKPEWLHALCENGSRPTNIYSPLILVSLLLSVWYMRN